MTPSLAADRSRRLILISAVTGVLAIAAIVVVVLLSQSPGRGLSQDNAVRIARTHVSTAATSVLSTEVRQNFDTGFGLPVHKWTWLVTFSGHWEIACSGNCVSSSEWVAIDYYTGDWIASQFEYPNPAH